MMRVEDAESDQVGGVEDKRLRPTLENLTARPEHWQARQSSHQGLPDRRLPEHGKEVIEHVVTTIVSCQRAARGTFEPLRLADRERIPPLFIDRPT